MTAPAIVFPARRGPYPDALNTLGGWVVTSWPGGRLDPLTGQPGKHGGVDLALPGGEPLYSCVLGPLSQGWDSTGGGNWSSLEDDAGPARFGYGHASGFAHDLAGGSLNGTTVPAGTLIAYVGTTGHSTGNHLHFAYAPTGGAWGDPVPLLAEAAAAGRYPGASTPITTAPDAPPAPTPDPSRKRATMIVAKGDQSDELWLVNLAGPWPVHVEDATVPLDGRPVHNVIANNGGPVKSYLGSPQVAQGWLDGLGQAAIIVFPQAYIDGLYKLG